MNDACPTSPTVALGLAMTAVGMKAMAGQLREADVTQLLARVLAWGPENRAAVAAALAFERGRFEDLEAAGRALRDAALELGGGRDLPPPAAIEERLAAIEAEPGWRFPWEERADVNG